MTRLALLCSGQGFQHSGMFALTADAEAAAPVFAAAKVALDGRDVRDVARNEDTAAMHDNATAQVLCCAQALAAVAVLNDVLADDDLVVAGYSVGELAAWGVVGVFDAASLLGLAKARAAIMDEAAARTPGGLAAVRGLTLDKLGALCREHGSHVAIVNGADQVVIGGTRDALAATLDAAREAGAGKVTELAVGVPSHTPLLANAVDPLHDALCQAKAHDLPADRRLLSGIDGAAVFSIGEGLDKLARQVAQTVDWQACMEACRAAGVARALELGPGGALAHLMAESLGPRNSRALDDFRSLDGVRRWLSAD